MTPTIWTHLERERHVREQAIVRWHNTEARRKLVKRLCALVLGSLLVAGIAL